MLDTRVGEAGAGSVLVTVGVAGTEVAVGVGEFGMLLQAVRIDDSRIKLTAAYKRTRSPKSLNAEPNPERIGAVRVITRDYSTSAPIEQKFAK